MQKWSELFMLKFSHFFQNILLINLFYISDKKYKFQAIYGTELSNNSFKIAVCENGQINEHESLIYIN